MLWLGVLAGEEITRKRAVIAIVLTALYASTDEFHQLFVPGRSGQVRDVLIDSCGAAIGVLIAWGLIRIYSNRELDVLENSIDMMIDRLNPGGRLCIITFHSLEDRIVKARFKNNENPCTCPPDFPVCVCGKKSKGKVITRKPIVPSDEELNENQRSKSSKLRVFERI